MRHVVQQDTMYGILDIQDFDSLVLFIQFSLGHCVIVLFNFIT